MKKIMIFLAAWKRPEITEICFMGIERMRDNRMFDVDAMAVISEPSMIDLCYKYGIKWCMHENLPLGKKKNYGLTQAMTHQFDYLLEIGSDDLVKNDIFELYAPHFDAGKDVIGLSEFVMMNSVDGECRKWSHDTGAFGVGRAISRRALDGMKLDEGYKLWDDTINRGLDNNSNFRLAIAGFLGIRVHSDEPVAIDIKSDENIHRYDFTPGGAPYDHGKAISGLSYAEKCALKSLSHVAV